MMPRVLKAGSIGSEPIQAFAVRPRRARKWALETPLGISKTLAQGAIPQQRRQSMHTTRTFGIQHMLQLLVHPGDNNDG